MSNARKIGLISLARKLVQNGTPMSEAVRITKKVRRLECAKPDVEPDDDDDVVDDDDTTDDEPKVEPKKKAKPKKDAAAAIARNGYVLAGMSLAVTKLEKDAARRADVKSRTFSTPHGSIVLERSELDACKAKGVEVQKFANTRAAIAAKSGGR